MGLAETVIAALEPVGTVVHKEIDPAGDRPLQYRDGPRFIENVNIWVSPKEPIAIEACLIQRGDGKVYVLNYKDQVTAQQRGRINEFFLAVRNALPQSTADAPYAKEGGQFITGFILFEERLAPDRYRYVTVFPIAKPEWVFYDPYCSRSHIDAEDTLPALISQPSSR